MRNKKKRQIGEFYTEKAAIRAHQEATGYEIKKVDLVVLKRRLMTPQALAEHSVATARRKGQSKRP